MVKLQSDYHPRVCKSTRPKPAVGQPLKYERERKRLRLVQQTVVRTTRSSQVTQTRSKGKPPIIYSEEILEKNTRTDNGQVAGAKPSPNTTFTEPKRCSSQQFIGSLSPVRRTRSIVPAVTEKNDRPENAHASPPRRGTASTDADGRAVPHKPWNQNGIIGQQVEAAQSLLSFANATPRASTLTISAQSRRSRAPSKQATSQRASTPLTGVIAKAASVAWVVDWFATLLTEDRDRWAHSSPGVPAPLPETNQDKYDNRKVTYLKGLLFPQMGARSTGAVPAEISCTGTIVAIIQSTLRIDFHSPDVMALMNKALGDLDSAPRVYLLLAEGKLRALKAYKLPPPQRTDALFPVLGLGCWTGLDLRLRSLFQLQTASALSSGSIQLRDRASSAHTRTYTDSNADERCAKPLSFTREENRAAAERASTRAVFGTHVPDVWCEYVSFVRTQVLEHVGAELAEGADDILEMLLGLHAVEEQMRLTHAKSSAVKRVVVLGAELTELLHRHHPDVAQLAAYNEQMMVQLPRFDPTCTLAQVYVGKALKTVSSVLTAALEPWEGTLQPESIVLCACRVIKSTLDKFASNLASVTDSAELISAPAVRQGLSDLDSAAAAVLRKIKLELYLVEPIVHERARSSMDAQKYEWVPLQAFTARVDAMLAGFPTKVKRDDDSDLLEVVNAY